MMISCTPKGKNYIASDIDMIGNKGKYPFTLINLKMRLTSYIQVRHLPHFLYQ
jgi:hypothetical protein